MEDELGRPAAFDREDPDGPTESDWIPIGDRRYKVLKIPSQLSGIVLYVGYGSVTQALIGTFFYARAACRSSKSAARMYGQRNRWHNGRWHQVLHQEFDTIDEAARRAGEFEQSLRDGHVPHRLEPLKATLRWVHRSSLSAAK